MRTEEQGVGHDDVIKDYDVIIVMSELVIPRMIPFPTIIYEPVLVPFILTWSLRDMCAYVCVLGRLCVLVCVCVCVCVWVCVGVHWRIQGVHLAHAPLRDPIPLF